MSMPWDWAVKRQNIVERHTKDEIVAHGYVHIERMSESHVWMHVCGVTLNMKAVRGPHGLCIEWDTCEAPTETRNRVYDEVERLAALVDERASASGWEQDRKDWGRIAAIVRAAPEVSE